MRETSTTEHRSDDALDDTTRLRVVPDLAGTPVDDASGLSAGSLFGLLAEADSGLLRYFDLALHALDRHVLVPVGHARVLDGPQVRLRAALLEDLEQIPPFPAELRDVTDPYERALLEAYGRTFSGDRYYAHPSYDHSGVYAGAHPIVAGSVAPDGALRPLGELDDWSMAHGEPDLRGWPLVLAGGERLAIRDVIADPTAASIRYVVVSRQGERDRLLPIGFLDVDRAADLARAPSLRLDDILALPVFEAGHIARAHEDAIARALRDRLAGPRRHLLPDYRAPDLDRFD